jgi:hypothetical protein
MSQLSDGLNTRTIMRVQGRVSAIVFSWSNVSSHMSRGAQGVAHFDNSSDRALYRPGRRHRAAQNPIH